ncbi:MAG: dihydrofolate reductase [Burkholderiaceae bacterium]|nr:dihydrofolate reductase [Burkholderiaceae bacterium]
MTAATITLIAALARNGVIGHNNQIPWKIPGELAYFKRMTMGHPIVMGRKTWESIGRPLPGRRNIVVSRDRCYAAPGAEVAGSLDEALHLVREAEAFVIGGAQIYGEAMPRAHRMLLTEIDADLEGDTFFPRFNRDEWRETRRENHPPTAERLFGYSFVTYER